MNFVSLINYHARCRPEEIALEEHESGATWTWSELSRDVQRIAAGLEAAGVRPGDGVGMVMRNSASFVQAFFGAVALGCYVVGVNTRYRADEIEFVLRDAQCRTLIYDAEFADTAEELVGASAVDRVVAGGSATGSAGEGLRLDHFLASAESSRSIEPRADDDLLTIIYTSGSTGRPKGVPYHHGLYRNLGMGLVDFFELSTDDCGLATSPMFHMSGHLMLSCGFALGGRNVTVARWDPKVMLRTIEDHHVSYMHMITTLMVDVVKLDPDVFMNVDTTSMRQTWCGGGAMSPDMIGEYERKVGGLVCEGWGRSEGGLSWNPPQVDRRLLGSQGRLMDQIFAMKIVDVEGHEVPVGQTGEIVARGDTVITSYWRRQDLDAALFDDEAWLRTGDAASLDEDGFLHFQGRIDHMIKTGGENVYPAEVEEALLDMPGVQDAAVIGTPDERLGQLVTAVVVPLDDAISSDAVEEWGRKTLAGYKRPRRVIVVEAIPRLANEKVDYPQVRRMLEATAGLRSVDDH